MLVSKMLCEAPIAAKRYTQKWFLNILEKFCRKVHFRVLFFVKLETAGLHSFLKNLMFF